MSDPLEEWDKKYLWHPFTQMKEWIDTEHHPLILTNGNGAYVTDSTGKQYLDGNASIWTNIHGHCHPHISAAIRNQLEKVEHVSFLGTSNEPAIKLAKALVELNQPSALSRVFYSDDGSTAIEVAVKLAIQYFQLVGRPERTQFAAFTDAYHGDTAGAASLGGVPTFFDRFASIQFNATRVSSLEDVQRIPRDQAKKLAAIVVEPMIRGVAGVHLWPAEFLTSLREWCDDHGVLLIYDEVLTGFGRTGEMFAWQHEGAAPDFLCLAKGLTGGALPLAATLTTEQVFSAFLGDYEELKAFFYGHSYCGNPLGCAAALASLEVFTEENTLEHVRLASKHLERELRVLLDSPWVRSTRQLGLLSGIELSKPDGSPFDWKERRGAAVCERAKKYGLLTRPIKDVIPFFPPLCITETQITEAIGALRTSISEEFQ